MSWLGADRSLHLAGSALVAGAIAFELLLLRPAPEAARAPELALRVRRWVRALAVLGVGVGLLSWVAWLAQAAIAMTGLPASEALTSSNLRTVVVRTTFGNVWALRLLLFL